MQHLHMIFSGLSALFTIVALGMFARAIVGGQSKPYVLAWGIRTALVAIAFLSQLVAGATYSLAMSGSQLVGCMLIVALIMYHRPRICRLGWSDWLAIIAAGAGVGVWMISGNPLHALCGTILADTAATILGIYAGVVRGTREAPIFWACTLVAASMATLAATGATSLTVVLAPIFSCCNAAANLGAGWYIKRQRPIRQGRLSGIAPVEAEAG